MNYFPQPGIPVHHYCSSSDLAMAKNIIANPTHAHVYFHPDEAVYFIGDNEERVHVDEFWDNFEIDADHPLHENFYHVNTAHLADEDYRNRYPGPKFGRKVNWCDYNKFRSVPTFLPHQMEDWNFFSVPEYLFSYTVRRPKAHRVWGLYHIMEMGLLGKGVVNFCNDLQSWNQFHRPGSFDPEAQKKILAQIPNIMSIPVEQRRLPHAHRYDMRVPGYELSLIDIVAETDNNIVMHTEKTVRAILFGKPFVVLGHTAQHDALKSLGYELFEELFDYKSDVEIPGDDRFQRYQRLLMPLKDIDHYTPMDMLDLKIKLREKIVHNQSVLVKRLFDNSGIPDNWMFPETEKYKWPTVNPNHPINRTRSLLLKDGYFRQFVDKR